MEHIYVNDDSHVNGISLPQLHVAAVWDSACGCCLGQCMWLLSGTVNVAAVHEPQSYESNIHYCTIYHLVMGVRLSRKREDND